MAYWLVKSEPSVYSFDEFTREKATSWTGIRNYAARIHLMAMEKGDKVLFYHSNKGMEIVGTAKVVRTFYDDPTSTDRNWVTVDLAAGKKLRKAVSLETIKSDPLLKKMELVRISRLSVCPVREEEWDRIMDLSSGKTD